MCINYEVHMISLYTKVYWSISAAISGWWYYIFFFIYSVKSYFPKHDNQKIKCHVLKKLISYTVSHIKWNIPARGSDETHIVDGSQFIWIFELAIKGDLRQGWGRERKIHTLLTVTENNWRFTETSLPDKTLPSSLLSNLQQKKVSSSFLFLCEYLDFTCLYVKNSETGCKSGSLSCFKSPRRVPRLLHH